MIARTQRLATSAHGGKDRPAAPSASSARSDDADETAEKPALRASLGGIGRRADPRDRTLSLAAVDKGDDEGTPAPRARVTETVSVAAPIPPGSAKERFPELDEVTIVSAQRGSMRARRALVERYQRPVLALVGRLLRGYGDSALVEDVAQETFLRVFRALPNFDRAGPARLSTWILTIACHRSIDELRRRRLEISPLEAGPGDVAANDRADENAERRMLARLLERAIDGLAPEYKATFVLRELHGLEYAEIAEILDIDLGTVKSRLNRARTRLRDALTEVYRA
jgi:RNA polymerase sigma-70 factor (ECF subfamily)